MLRPGAVGVCGLHDTFLAGEDANELRFKGNDELAWLAPAVPAVCRCSTVHACQTTAHPAELTVHPPERLIHRHSRDTGSLLSRPVSILINIAFMYGVVSAKPLFGRA